MKKLIALILALLSFCCLFVGCTEEEKQQIIESLNFNYSDTTPMTDEDIDKALTGNLEAIQNYSSWKKGQLVVNDKITEIVDETSDKEPEVRNASMTYRADKEKNIFYLNRVSGEHSVTLYATSEYNYETSREEGVKGTKRKMSAEEFEAGKAEFENMIFGNDDALFYLFKKCDAKKLNDLGVKTFVTKEGDNVVFRFDLSLQFLKETFPEFAILGYVGGDRNLFAEEGVTVELCEAKYIFDLDGNFINATQHFKVLYGANSIEEATCVLTEYTGELTINEDDFEEVKDNKD